MLPRLKRLAALCVALAPLSLGGCGDPPPLYVDQAYVRLSPNEKTPSAGYFTVHGGQTPVQLRDVITDRALRIEMHESMNAGGKMTMKPLQSVDIPAKTEVAFAPGGKHLMLWGVNPTAISQGTIPLTFLFSNGDRIIVDATIQKTGGAAPADHGAH